MSLVGAEMSQTSPSAVAQHRSALQLPRASAPVRIRLSIFARPDLGHQLACLLKIAGR